MNMELQGSLHEPPPRDNVIVTQWKCPVPDSLTHHAHRRLRQHGIPEDVLPLLMQFGAHEYDKHGEKVVFLNHRGKDRLRRSVGDEKFRHIEPILDIYAVVDTRGTVVMVGHRTQRINRN